MAASLSGAGCAARAPASDAAAVTGADASIAAGHGPDSVVIAAAGDIACGGCEQGATADLLDQLLQSRHIAAVLPLGDEAYASGLLSEFQSFYAPSWGRPELLAITHPIPGNHEYADAQAAGYFDFFDGSGRTSGIAGPRGAGYYSFDVGGWHLIALNTSDECRWVSCDAGSPQHQWLVADLAAHPSSCTLAFWHHPRFQAGTVSGEAVAAAPLWDALFDAGAEIVLNGHEHGYQQLAPLNKAGEVDAARGIRTFIVGTGGGDYDTTFGGPHAAALEAKIVGVHGVLEMTLRRDGYDWRFITVGGDTPDGASGSAACH
ncbi:MAG TPA: metallophosphoesterase [Polyangia bacterium]|nr:metallophosphoesterase [Polyangia bacterium]